MERRSLYGIVVVLLLFCSNVQAALIGPDRVSIQDLFPNGLVNQCLKMTSSGVKGWGSCGGGGGGGNGGTLGSLAASDVYSSIANGTGYFTTIRINNGLIFNGSIFNTNFAGRSTTNLAEGTNLYYTGTRVNGDVAQLFTTNGFIARTGLNTFSGRIFQTDNGISMTNNGGAGNPRLTFDQTLIPTAVTPGGSNGQLQIRSNSTTFAGSNTRWDTVNGRLALRHSAPDTVLDVNGALTFRPGTTSPADPDSGAAVVWLSGASSSTNGDIILKSNVGSTTKTFTLYDYSANGVPGASAGGSNTQFQFNDSGAFAGNGALTFTKASKTLAIASDAPFDINSTTLSIADDNISLDGASTTFTQTTGGITFSPATGSRTSVNSKLVINGSLLDLRTRTQTSIYLGNGAGANSNGTTTFNTALGFSALRGTSGTFTGDRNTILGYATGLSFTSASDNTAVGHTSMNNQGNDLTGSWNTCLGSTSCVGINGVANGNVAIGFNALNNSFLSGSRNIAIGYKAGEVLSTGSSNIVIGVDIDPPSSSTSNRMTIGNLLYGNGMTATGTTVSTGKIGIKDPTPSFDLDVNGTTFSKVVSAADFTTSDTNISLTGASTTFTQSTGAITMTPASGSNFNITTAGIGDFVVNTSAMIVNNNGDTALGSTFFAGGSQLTVNDGTARTSIISSTDGANVGLVLGADNSGGTQRFSGLYYVPSASAISAFQCLSVDNTNCHFIVSGNGDVSIGTGAISPGTFRMQIAKPVTNNNFATMRQVAVGVDSNANYNFSLGYGFSGASFSGILQPYDNNVGSQLLLNPVGGNVGIFDGTPDYKLDVNGTLGATQVTLTTGASNGYVLVSNPSGTASWRAGYTTRKALDADQIITSSTTLVDGTGMSVPVSANKKYYYEATIVFTASDTAGYKIGIGLPSSVTNAIYSIVCARTNEGTPRSYGGHSQTASFSVQDGGWFSGTNVDLDCIISGTVETNANTGNLSFQFAQRVSSVNSITLRNGSVLEVTEI